MRFFFIFFCLISITQCSKILGVFPVSGKSHFTAAVTLMKILAENGHEITMISPTYEKNLPENIKNIVVSPNETSAENIDFFSFDLHPFLQTYIYQLIGPSLVNETLSHPEFKKFLKIKQKFDVIIIEQFYTDGLRYLSLLFDAPIILYSALDASQWTNPTVSNPSPPSYVSDILLPYTGDLTFIERLLNSLMMVLNEFLRNFKTLPLHDKIVKENFPEAPNIEEYYYKPSLVLLNADLSVNDAIPKVPNMINIGGFHIKKPKKLPEDLQIILDKATNGVIYFSLGSNIKSVNMPKKILNSILKVFSTLNETIFWKWEDDNLPGKSSNVVIRKWYPQNDIFAHKNIKVFITHGGIFSTLEAVYHGIPCLSLPIFGDQTINAKRATFNGYAKWIKFNDVNEENFSNELKELLTNNRYKENAIKRSKIMKDKPLSPSDTLNFWVNYVIRHKGAEHLKVSAINLNWFQYLLLDVISFILIISIFIIFCIKYVFRYFFTGKNKVKTS